MRITDADGMRITCFATNTTSRPGWGQPWRWKWDTSSRLLYLTVFRSRLGRCSCAVVRVVGAGVRAAGIGGRYRPAVFLLGVAARRAARWVSCEDIPDELSHGIGDVPIGVVQKEKKARGAVCNLGRGVLLIENIPAGAGSRPDTAPSRSTPGDHPRWRGEQRYCTVGQFVEPGSSPLAWGADCLTWVFDSEVTDFRALFLNPTISPNHPNAF